MLYIYNKYIDVNLLQVIPQLPSQGSTSFPQQDGSGAHIEVYHVFLFEPYIAAEVLPYTVNSDKVGGSYRLRTAR